MSIARIESTQAVFDNARAACSAISAGATETLSLLADVVGGAGFFVIDNAGSHVTVSGVKKSDGTYPQLASLGVAKDGPNQLAYHKGIGVLERCASGVVQNLHLVGAVLESQYGANGAGIRISPTCVVSIVQNVHCGSNQNGVLSASAPGATRTYIDSVFEGNGLSDAGNTHNMYEGACDLATFTRCEFLDAVNGHDLKSRAKRNVITQCRMEGSKTGRAFDCSEGGIVESSHNEYRKHADAIQNNLIHIMPEPSGDGRPESYSFTNDLFDIGIENHSRGLQFIQNDGNTEVVLTDPKFILTGVEISDADAMKLMTGKSPVRIVLTGGPRGPQKPVGCGGDIKSLAGTAPAAPVAPAPAPVPAPAAAWTVIGKEGDTITVNPGDVVRYGANGQYVTKTVTVATFMASNDFFGSDPAVGIQKTVERQALPAIAAPAVIPAPIPAPVAAPAQSTVTDALIAACKTFLVTMGYTVTK